MLVKMFRTYQRFAFQVVKKGTTSRWGYKHSRFELLLSDGQVLFFHTLYIHDQVGGLANGVYLYRVSLEQPSRKEEGSPPSLLRLEVSTPAAPTLPPRSPQLYFTCKTEAVLAPSRPRSPTPEEWHAQAEPEPMELEQPEALSPTEIEQRPLALSDLQTCVLELFEQVLASGLYELRLGDESSTMRGGELGDGLRVSAAGRYSFL